jgi:HPt (histidine-containing phosphotransfer) domain-containing protein
MDDLPELEEEDTSIDISIPESFGNIDLNDVKPIHFDFRLEEAANDLSLPVELIEEFVHDFIDQAHTETKNMLDAYEKGDLETIQKIGHMLKGASSNLRIKALSETLYKIQFCEKSEEMEDLIKDYWGHFLAFETQINLTSQ